MDRGGTMWLNVVDDDFPRDMTVLEAKSEVQTKNFKTASTPDGIYNHHNVFIDFSKVAPVVFGCRPKPMLKLNIPGAIFVGGTADPIRHEYMNSKTGLKTGFYLGKNRQLINMVDVVNYKNYSQEIYTSTDIEYLPGKPEGYLDANLVMLDPGMCGGGMSGNFVRPPLGAERFTVNSTGIYANSKGYMLNVRGHLHDGGINIILKVNDRLVCDSRAIYGGPTYTTKTADGKIWETIRETTTCHSPVKVDIGDKIYMQAFYDLDLHPSRHAGGMGMGGMGMMGGMGGMGGMMGGKKNVGEAEQMALFNVFFAATP